MEIREVGEVFQAEPWSEGYPSLRWGAEEARCARAERRNFAHTVEALHRILVEPTAPVSGALHELLGRLPLNTLDRALHRAEWLVGTMRLTRGRRHG